MLYAFGSFGGPNGELVDPAGDGGAASIGEVDGTGDFVKGDATVGEKSVEVEAADAGKDVPDKGQGNTGELGRLEVTAEARS